MGCHLWRPFFAVVAFVGLLLAARAMTVPKDFGVGSRGYMYAWRRSGNEAEWKAVEARYKPPDYCNTCHADQRKTLSTSPHTIINCQACHGPALNHPENPPKLKINRSRDLCIRCHAALPYPTSGRAMVRGIDPAKHFPDNKCVDCHKPHSPSLGR